MIWSPDGHFYLFHYWLVWCSGLLIGKFYLFHYCLVGCSVLSWALLLVLLLFWLFHKVLHALNKWPSDICLNFLKFRFHQCITLINFRTLMIKEKFRNTNQLLGTLHSGIVNGRCSNFVKWDNSVASLQLSILKQLFSSYFRVYHYIVQLKEKKHLKVSKSGKTGI